MNFLSKTVYYKVPVFNQWCLTGCLTVFVSMSASLRTKVVGDESLTKCRRNHRNAFKMTFICGVDVIIVTYSKL